MGQLRNTSRSRSRVRGVAAAIVVVLFVAPGAALAKDSPPSGASAVNQYVEVIPTGGGGVAAGAAGARSNPIPKRVGALIARQGGHDRVKLREVDSSPAYGAPQKRHTQRPVRPRGAAPHSPSALSAAISASGSGTGSHALWLGAILVLSTLGALVAAGMRQRRLR
jgi:hypothetical protein